MELKYDRDADAAYVSLKDKQYAYGLDLDDQRRIDYAADDTPIGIELLIVSGGVDLERLPCYEDILGLLQMEGIRGYPPPRIELNQGPTSPQVHSSRLDITGDNGAEGPADVKRVEGPQCTSTLDSFATTLR